MKEQEEIPHLFLIRNKQIKKNPLFYVICAVKPVQILFQEEVIAVTINRHNVCYSLSPKALIVLKLLLCLANTPVILVHEIKLLANTFLGI